MPNFQAGFREPMCLGTRMNGTHDIGGKHGFGPIVPEADEPPFHAPWEGRMHGIAVTCQVSGVNTTPEQRTTIENMSPALYLGTSYHENWGFAYEKLLNDKGVAPTEEFSRRVKEQADERVTARPDETKETSDYAKKLRSVLDNGTPHDPPFDRPAKFMTGDHVRARNINQIGHTRFHLSRRGRLELSRCTMARVVTTKHWRREREMCLSISTP
jgi:hypothetical protein